MKDGFATAQQLAGVAGMPATKSGVLRRARAEGWRYRTNGGRGTGRIEYDLRDLPAETRQAIAEQLLAAQPAPQLPAPATASAPPASATVFLLPGAVASVGVPALDEAAGGALSAAGARATRAVMNRRDPEALADWQKDAAYARMAIVRRVEAAAPAAGSMRAALDLVRAKLRDGTDADLVSIARRANVRARDALDISRATFFRWSADLQKGGVWELAPEESNREKLPPWARACMQLWARPQKPSIAYVHEHIGELLEQAGIEAPSYSQLRRFISQRLGTVARNAGRMGPRELLSVQPFIRRKTDHMWPTEVYTADGHTFDAEVAHPVHGKPFRPEITLVLDVGTRKAVGFSVALDESGLAVLDAQRHAFTTHGICSAWYVDRGSGYNNALQHCEKTGIAERFGFTIKHSLPYRSQSRGLIERAHQTILVRAAKELPTYMGAVMDREARQRVYRITRHDVKAMGRSALLMPWDAFIPFIQQAVDDYNDRPHRANAKLRAADGRLRHMSPNESWAAAVKDGFKPVLPEADAVGDLFFPQTQKKVQRGELRLHGKTYFSRDLAEWHGEIVRVAFDVHDPRYVFVRDPRGRLITRAEINGNAADYLAESFLQEAARKRAAARKRRLDTRLEEVQHELAAANAIDVQPTREYTPAPDVQQALQAANAERRQALQARIEAADAQAPAQEQAAKKRPVFDLESERYEWLMTNRSEWRDGDDGFCRRFAATELYELLIERWQTLGIVWREEGNQSPEKAAD